MIDRPPDGYCPQCGEDVQPHMAAGGYAPEGFEPEYDHYFCYKCSESFELDEVKPDLIQSMKAVNSAASNVGRAILDTMPSWMKVKP